MFLDLTPARCLSETRLNALIMCNVNTVSKKTSLDVVLLKPYMYSLFAPILFDKTMLKIY